LEQEYNKRSSLNILSEDKGAIFEALQKNLTPKIPQNSKWVAGT
jgi:hypothetical protein